MAEQINDGGPAFPCHTDQLQVCATTGHEKVIPVLNGGMSIRDWFAGQALDGILSQEGAVKGYESNDATRAYAIADAMIAARTGGTA